MAERLTTSHRRALSEEAAAWDNLSDSERTRFFDRARPVRTRIRRPLLPVDVEDVSQHASGRSVSHVTQPDARRLEIHFTDHSVLSVRLLQQRLVATLARRSGDATGKGFDHGLQPTRRQREYLAFIERYSLRFGVSPAESDIGRHFLVSAPSVNHMVQTLERRGFITRQRGVPRSISIVAR